MTLHLAVGLTAVVAAFVLPRQPVLTCDTSPLIIRNTTVWTGNGPLRARDVSVRDGRIASIDSATARATTSMRTVDGTGHTLLPGLIDSHLHFSIPGGLPPDGKPRADGDEITGRQLLRSGVTSGRLHLATLEDAVRLKARSSNPCAPLPRLQVGGPGLSGAVDRDFGNFQGVRSREAALEKVERFRSAGIDWIAIHDAERFGPGILETLATAARKAGVRLMASGNSPPEITAALSVAPDTLDYFDRTDRTSYGDEMLDAIRKQRTLILVPTPGVPYRTVEYSRDESLLDRPDNFDLFETTDRLFVRASAKTHLDAEVPRARRVLASLPAKFAQLRQLGLPMAIGSDAGSPLQFQANAIWWELEAWRSLGVSHRDALIAATEHGARVLQSTAVGRLTVGQQADFILYRGDVESGAFDVNRVIAVAKDGVLFVENGKWK